MEFVELNQINSGDIYDSKGRKLESSEDQGQVVHGLIETGTSYVVRVQYYSSIGSQNFYYLVKITDNGVGEMKWICFTENENIRNDDELFNEDGYESNLDENDENYENLEMGF